MKIQAHSALGPPLKQCNCKHQLTYMNIETHSAPGPPLKQCNCKHRLTYMKVQAHSAQDHHYNRSLRAITSSYAYPLNPNQARSPKKAPL